jgi:hypothetical protein
MKKGRRNMKRTIGIALCLLVIYAGRPLSADAVGYELSRLIVSSLSTMKDSGTETLEAFTATAPNDQASRLHILVVLRGVVAKVYAVQERWRSLGAQHPDLKKTADVNVLMLDGLHSGSQGLLDGFLKENYSINDMSLWLAMIKNGIDSIPKVVPLSVVATRDFSRSESTHKIALRITDRERTDLLSELRAHFPSALQDDTSKQDVADKMAAILITFYSNPDLLTEDPIAGTPFAAQSSKQLFEELRDAGGVHPLAQLVCFPAAGQNLDTTFVLVAFSKDLASTLRAQGKPVPKEFLDAATAPEKDRFLLEWSFRNGVELQKDPETLGFVVGSNGTMWSMEFNPPDLKKEKFAVRMVFSPTGRYSRDVLVDSKITASVYGRCEPIP